MFTGSVVDALETGLATKSSVCSSVQAVDFFTRLCSNSECTVVPSRLEDTYLTCQYVYHLG